MGKRFAITDCVLSSNTAYVKLYLSCSLCNNEALGYFLSVCVCLSVSFSFSHSHTHSFPNWIMRCSEIEEGGGISNDWRDN